MGDGANRGAGVRGPSRDTPARGSTRVSIPFGTVTNAGSRDARAKVAERRPAAWPVGAGP